MEKKTKTILVVVIGVTIIVGASLFIIFQGKSSPPEGWTHDAELTQQWIEDKYGTIVLPPCGGQRVYVKDQLTYPKPIRLYGENCELEGWPWELVDEGFVDVNGIMYWD